MALRRDGCAWREVQLSSDAVAPSVRRIRLRQAVAAGNAKARHGRAMHRFSGTEARQCYLHCAGDPWDARALCKIARCVLVTILCRCERCSELTATNWFTSHFVLKRQPSLLPIITRGDRREQVVLNACGDSIALRLSPTGDESLICYTFFHKRLQFAVCLRPVRTDLRIREYCLTTNISCVFLFRWAFRAGMQQPLLSAKCHHAE